ncbi:MAG: hypothetical protein H6577_17590 [Lewinellaceae bacterium]|nr:hypothetical protein [Lewinellaceae bacterium]
MNKLIFLLPLLCSLWMDAVAQKAALRFSPKMAETFLRSPHVDFSKNYQMASWRYFQKEGRPAGLPVPTALPDIYDCNALAFFCRVEVKLEKVVTFPVKFRLGDVQYVDKLEGKH